MTTPRTHKAQVVGVLAAMLLVAPALAGCSDGGGAGGGGTRTKLTVFAAASLTGTFTSLAERFEDDHPDVDVVLSFGSSTTLAEQVDAGSPADVLATADEKSIGLAADDGALDGQPTEFATNTLVIVTPPDNPGGVSSIDDLDDTDFVVCDPSVPCGAAAATILDNAGVTTEPRSLEEDVKAVLTKVTLGEADAGIVYVTDAQAAREDVSTVDIAPDLNVVNPYFIGVVKDSGEPRLAQQWVDLVTSRAGHEILTGAGFGAAP